MASNEWLERMSQHERVNFLLTNRIPRRYATLLMGRLSRVENRFVRAISFARRRLPSRVIERRVRSRGYRFATVSLRAAG